MLQNVLQPHEVSFRSMLFEFLFLMFYFRWVGVRMNLCGAAFTTSLATYLVYGKNRPSPGNIGFLLATAGKLS